MQCCCGKYDFDTDSTEDLIPVVFNDTMHEVLGPEGNFCGPVHLHTIRNLERKCAAQAELIGSLQASLKESDARVAGLLGEVKSLKEMEVKRKICGLVNIEDYEDLEAKNKRLREEVKRLREALEAIAEFWQV